MINDHVRKQTILFVRKKGLSYVMGGIFCIANQYDINQHIM